MLPPVIAAAADLSFLMIIELALHIKARDPITNTVTPLAALLLGRFTAVIPVL